MLDVTRPSAPSPTRKADRMAARADGQRRRAAPRGGTAALALLLAGPAALLAGPSSLLGGAAFAQTASQVTPPSFQPPPGRSSSSIVFSGQAGLGTPAGADKLNVRLQGVTIEGARAELADAQRELEARLVGRRIAAAEIFAAARDLEAAFARAGFVLARVVLPAQTLTDGGRIRLVVVQGFVERIDIQGAPDNVRKRLEEVLAPLLGQRDLTQGAIERQLLLAGDTPGVALRSALGAGQQNGGAVLTVETRYRPISGFIGTDNTLSRSIGRWSLGSGLDANTLLGAGETFYVRSFGNPTGNERDGFGSFVGDKPRLRTLAAGSVIPIGVDGLTLNIEGTESRTTPRPRDLIQSSSDYNRFSTRLRYPWVRSREYNLYSEFAFDVTSEKLNLLAGGATLPLSLDRLRIFRLAADGDYRLSTNGLVAGRAVLSFGTDALGARSAADATPILPLSRFGADAEFQKLEGVVSYTQPLQEHLTAGLYFRGQTSFGQALPRSEQIGTASFQELSTFDIGTLGGDSGYIVRGELSAPFVLPVEARPINIAPYVFGATSGLFQERPTALERASGQFTSAGGGVRFAAALDDAFTQATLSLEYGRRFRDDGFSNANRFTLVGAIRW